MTTRIRYHVDTFTLWLTRPRRRRQLRRDMERAAIRDRATLAALHERQAAVGKWGRDYIDYLRDQS